MKSLSSRKFDFTTNFTTNSPQQLAPSCPILPRCQLKYTFYKSREPLQNRAFRGKTRRNKTMIKILFVCHGNICRSTLAQSVFTHKVASQGLSAHFLIDSAATSTEEIGNPPHRGTVNKLRKVGIPLVPHRARQVTWADYEKFDYIIGMDSANIRNLNRMLKGDPEGKIYKFLTFAGSDRDIADPWYTGDFDATYEDVLEGCVGFLAYLKEQGQI